MTGQSQLMGQDTGGTIEYWVKIQGHHRVMGQDTRAS